MHRLAGGLVMAVASAAAWPMPAGPDAGSVPPGLHEAVLVQARAFAHARVSAQGVEPALVSLQLELVAPRGSARAICSGDWHVPQVDFTRFHRSLVPVACEGSQGSVVARLTVSAPVPTLAGARAAGHVLEAADLLLETRALGSWDWTTSAQHLVGQTLRRALPQGARFRASDLERPELVRKGDTVEITSGQGSVSVSVAGVALASGRMDDIILVRNHRNALVVEGRVSGAGLVEGLGVRAARPAAPGRDR
jgi:flagellar basal body P-ring formation protein FlgA